MVKKIHFMIKVLGIIAIIATLTYAFIVVIRNYNDENARKLADQKTYNYMYMECNDTGEIKTLYKEFTKTKKLTEKEMDVMDKQTGICWRRQAIEEGSTIVRLEGVENKQHKKVDRQQEVICYEYSHVCWPHRDPHLTCIKEPELCQYPHLVDDSPYRANHKIIIEEE